MGPKTNFNNSRFNRPILKKQNNIQILKFENFFFCAGIYDTANIEKWKK